jgi:hypothetical protein
MGKITLAGRTVKSYRDRKGIIRGLLATVVFGTAFFLGDGLAKSLTVYLLFFSIVYCVVSFMKKISYCKQCNEIFDYGTKVCPDCGFSLINDTFGGDIEKKLRAKLNELEPTSKSSLVLPEKSTTEPGIETERIPIVAPQKKNRILKSRLRLWLNQNHYRSLQEIPLM